MAAPAKYSELITIVEGTTKILVPSMSLQSSVATKREPVFFNPAAELNRDISIVAYDSFLSNSSFGCNGKMHSSKNNRDNVVMADSLCGTGARGLRVAVESSEVDQVYFNDANPLAIDVARKSSAVNHVEDKCHFSVSKACRFLLKGTNERHSSSPDTFGEEKTARLGKTGERFTIVDLDPFGSPAAYVDCVIRSVEQGGLVSITATDTAVLRGKYPDVCLRKYYGLPLNNSYSNELALRLLLSLVALTSSRLGIYIYPLFAHTNLHYLRVYVKVIESSKLANSVFGNIGYVQHCFHCGNRIVSDDQSRAEKCTFCSTAFKTAGWLWTGRMYDKNFIHEMMVKTSQRQGSNGSYELNCSSEEDITPSTGANKIQNRKMKNLQRLFSTCIREHDDIPYYFTSDEVASRLKIGPPSLATIVESLSKAGFRTSQTGLNSTAFKTTANINEIISLFRV